MDKTKQQEKPLYIKIAAEDNVAIIVNEGGLDKGTVFSSGLKLVEHVPQGHKVALVDIGERDKIIRYGQIIGYAKENIACGRWIDETMVYLPEAPLLSQIKKSEDLIKTDVPKLEGYTFLGYRNADGSAGIRNIFGILPSVQCVVGVLEKVVERLKKEVLPKYPYVDDIVILNHSYGCGVAINAPEAKVPIRTLQNLAIHPNLGGELLLVGLGCEKLQPNRLLPKGRKHTIVVLQEEHGYAQMIDTLMRESEECLVRLNKRRRVSCPASDLIIGLQCGGSDAFSGVTANPAVGYAADLLVRTGATVMFSEVTEVRDAIHLLVPRAKDPATAEKLLNQMSWYDHYLELGGADRSANPAPGNKKGGLANIVEKALGSIAKSGSMPIAGVLEPGEKAEDKGLLYAATPASDFICGTMQLASGMHLQVFSTGRGTPYGLAMAPVIKVSTRNYLKDQWADLIDINAGRIATGEATIEAVGKEIFELILAVASGEKEPWAEHWKFANDLCVFNPAPVT
ncbi:MAG: galactarate dehydratase [Selenomonadaceae bacterium]